MESRIKIHMIFIVIVKNHQIVEYIIYIQVHFMIMYDVYFSLHL